MDNLDYKILQTLSDNNYHSGEKLAQLFNTSRAAICKRISKLNNYLHSANNSLNIFAVVGKGYCLSRAYDFICVEQISKQLSINNGNLTFVPIVDSTNNYLINSSIERDQYYICIAEQQTSGRGRNTIVKQKNWYSPFGNNIYCSLAWHYPGSQSTLLGLSLIAGISAAEVIQDRTDIKVSLKWPNDILINNCKVAGVLTEIFGEPNGGCKLVLGFGINVHNARGDDQITAHKNAIDQPWTTLANHTHQILCRNNLLAHLINTFINNYQLFIKFGLEYFSDKWQLYDGLKNSMVNIAIANNNKLGKYLGIDQSGGIVVEIDGQRQIFHSGEVSIRAIHDYIN